MKKIFLLILTIFMVTQGFSQFNQKISIEIQKQVSLSLALCKTLHQNPELSKMEINTSRRMAEVLESAGLEVYPSFAGNSLVGILKNGDGPVVMLRTDMDALPVEEKTGLEFASIVKTNDANGNEVSVMHACGHDIHMSVWAGVIRTLVAVKDQWKGTLMVIAQQAEEVSGGANLAVESGLFKKFPVPDYAFSYHINPELESGQIGLVGGPVFAGVKTVRIKVFGKGGHGAYPEKCIDPVVIASRIVLDLQTIVSRELSPLEPAVITVGSIHGGTRPNIIPDEVDLELTLRFYSQVTLDKMVAGINRICRSAAQMAGMPNDQLPKVVVEPENTPPVINNEELVAKVRAFAIPVVGENNIIKTSPAMVGEDFGVYGETPEKVPICLIWLGSTSPGLMKELTAKGEKPAPLHSPNLAPDYEKTIETGIRVMVANVLGLMKK
jgi:hippurate hydrolase